MLTSPDDPIACFFAILYFAVIYGIYFALKFKNVFISFLPIILSST